jgi:hypothetical protein
MRIYPSPGLIVRDPVKRDALPETGREVPDDDIYWLRRLACGDATTTQPTAPAVQPPPKVEKPTVTVGSDTQ